MTGAKSILLMLLLAVAAPINHALPGSFSETEENPKYSAFEIQAKQSYEELGLQSQGLLFATYLKGFTGYYNLKNAGKLNSSGILTIIDFGLSSTKKRMWIIDLDDKKILFHNLVAHGKNTGEDMAVAFSNTVHSNMSSLGFFITGDTYCGKHGLSLYLDGVDPQYNSNARERSVVMHGADYVCDDFIKENGRLGRSHGCPAVPMAEHKEIIQTLKNKSCLFIHHPSQPYKSSLLGIPGL